MEFKVGDRVGWLGMKGTVSRVDPSRTYDAVSVEMDNRGVGDVFHFYEDGRYLQGQRPSLKKLKKKKARYFYVNVDGEIQDVDGNEYSTMGRFLRCHWLKDCGTKKPKGA